MNNLFNKACQCYKEECEHYGFVFQQPSESCSKVGWKYIHLANNYRQLAKYLIKEGKLLNPDKTPFG